MSRSIFRFFACVLASAGALSIAVAQPKSHASWTASFEPADVRAGESARILLTAKVVDTWHLYSMEKRTGEGPRPTVIQLQPGGGLEPQGQPVEPTPEKIHDKGFDIDVGVHGGTVIFAIPVKVRAGASGEQKAKAVIDYQVCNDRTCDPPAHQEFEVKFSVAPGAPRSDHLTALTAVPDQPGGVAPKAAETAPSQGANSQDDFVKNLGDAQKTSLPAYLWLCFLAGLASLLMPCVFPMIPVTVSFFSKKSGDDKKANYAGALAYCLGIISTFTALGILITVLFGATGIQKLAANPIVNLFLALLFVALAASLFGLFEIVVPSSVVTKLSSKSRGGGLVGPLLMGLTFTLTSFTCTVPVVGTLLFAASKGDLLYPVLGMLAFSTAFAGPFFLLALFPQAISKLPRSGMWMVTLKAFMGFLELAFALKFLSNIDLVLNLGWITREVFLAVWAVLAAIGGLYLLGWIRLGSEEGKTPIGLLRRGFGVATLGSAVVCLAGIQGFSLGRMDSFVPPDPYPGRVGAAGAIAWQHDYKAALAQAKSTNKLLFINFTGVTCTNCRLMEKNVLPQSEVVREIADMIPVELYTDRNTPEDNFNKQLEEKLANTVSLPVYVVVTPNEKALKSSEGISSTSDFVAFIKQGKTASGALARR